MVMIDREKVIKELENYEPYARVFSSITVTGPVILNVLTLLKEQEPILLENQHKPYGISTNANSPWISRCPRCSKKVEGKQTRFCKYCGQAVKWE